MKIASLTARYLLGLVFLIFGLNGFFQFLKMPPPTGAAGAFLGALASSPYISVVFAIQLLGGVLLLLGQYVPLALTILAPIIVNILLFHLFLAPQGLPPAAVVTILWVLVYMAHRSNFAGLLANRK